MIKAENLSFGFPQKDLYKNITFNLEENQHCVFIGTNGAGKSTLLDLIRNPEYYMYDGKLKMLPGIRIGYVSQFSEEDRTSTLTVFQYLSREFVKIQNEMTRICDDMGNSEELELLMEQYQDIMDAFQAIDGDNYENNIRKELKTAGLEKQENQQLIKLSGGEYKLIQILKEMIVKPDLLIMDEPDGFLDFENLIALKDLINSYKGTMLVITHNRYLLNHCFNKILHLENTEIQEFDGNYTEYQFTLLQTKMELQEAAAADEEEIERNRKVVEKLRNDATRYTNAARGRALQGRVSLLKRLEARKIKAPFVEIHQPEIHLPDCQPVTGDFALKVSDYCARFDEVLLEHVNFEIGPNEKAAIVGPNGTGKTTMLRDIFKEDSQTIEYGEGAEVAFLSQMAGETLNENHTIMEEFYELGFQTEQEINAYLNDYCITEEMLHSRVSQLSGGEKNLLQLAKISAGNASLLLLDEPTSHLDTYSQVALEKAISEYSGAVLMVSHDFYTVANCMDYVLFIESGTVRKMSMRRFRQMVYADHFEKNYLELEQKKKELEIRIARALEASDFETGQTLCEQLEAVIKKMA